MNRLLLAMAFIPTGLVKATGHRFVTYLTCWDGDRVWAAGAHLLGKSAGPGLLDRAHAVKKVGWALGGLAGTGLLLTTRSFLPVSLLNDLFYLGVGAAALVVIGWILGMRRG